MLHKLSSSDLCYSFTGHRYEVHRLNIRKGENSLATACETSFQRLILRQALKQILTFISSVTIASLTLWWSNFNTSGLSIYDTVFIKFKYRSHKNDFTGERHSFPVTQIFALVTQNIHFNFIQIACALCMDVWLCALIVEVSDQPTNFSTKLKKKKFYKLCCLQFYNFIAQLRVGVVSNVLFPTQSNCVCWVWGRVYVFVCVYVYLPQIWSAAFLFFCLNNFNPCKTIKPLRYNG